MKKTVDGKEIEYDVDVFHNSITTFDLWDIIKLLFGRKFHVNSKIYLVGDQVVAGTNNSYVEPLFKHKPNYGYGLISPAEAPAPKEQDLSPDDNEEPSRV